MKDRYKLILMAIVLVVGLFCVFLNRGERDSLRFKKEYESLNGGVNSQGKEYLSVDIISDNAIKYADYDRIEEILTNGTGVIYFGFPECPWCRNMIGPLLLAARDKKISDVYYFNAYSIRDKKHLDDKGNVVVDVPGTSEYSRLVSMMEDFLTPYEGLNDDSIKRLYFPTVVFVLEGNIVDIHIGTLSEQKDPYVPLDDKQKEKLINIYKKGMDKIISTSCSDKC